MPDLTRDEIAAIRADAAGPLVHIRKVVESVVPICDAYLALLDRVEAARAVPRWEDDGSHCSDCESEANQMRARILAALEQPKGEGGEG